MNIAKKAISATFVAVLAVLMAIGFALVTPAIADSAMRRVNFNIDAVAGVPDLAETLPHLRLAPARSMEPVHFALLGALAAYQAKDLAKGDALAAHLLDDLSRTAAEWAALVAMPAQMPAARIVRFLTDHPSWPGSGWLQTQFEIALLRDKAAAPAIFGFFAGRTPVSPAGTLALARAFLAADDREAAAALVQPLWRRADISLWLEAQTRTEFGTLLRPSDHDARAAREFYRQHFAGAMRAASLAGKDETALIQAAFALSRNQRADSLLAKVPAPLRQDATLHYAHIVQLWTSNHPIEAGEAMLAANRTNDARLDGDQWWRVQREIARALLDKSRPDLAYQICAQHAATSNIARVDAEFHAGWIALRFLHNLVNAQRHFGAVVALAQTPMSLARGLYWQGRTLQAAGDEASARRSFEQASQLHNYYYGQLAQRSLDQLAQRSIGIIDTDPENMVPLEPAKGDNRTLVVRVAELLQLANATPLAEQLMRRSAEHLTSRRDMAALAQIVRAAHHAPLALAVGKIAMQRGFDVGKLAYPAYGIPPFQPLADTASPALIHAIARQESEFRADVVSSAGARGLMQLMVSTAQRTANAEKVHFDLSRLTNDPSYNVQLGAAFLGLLMKDQRGSLILTLAAYNAGGRRVKEWIAAHGDPRQQSVDTIDWVEQIPINETRNYVQRVLENQWVYDRLLAPSLRQLPHDAVETANSR